MLLPCGDDLILYHEQQGWVATVKNTIKNYKNLLNAIIESKGSLIKTCTLDPISRLLYGERT